MQTVQTLIRRWFLRRLIWVYSVCQCPLNGTLGLNGLTSTTLWANSADDKLTIFFLFLQDIRILNFMIICQILLSGKNKKTISMRGLLKILSIVLSVNVVLNDHRYTHTYTEPTLPNYVTPPPPPPPPPPHTHTHTHTHKRAHTHLFTFWIYGRCQLCFYQLVAFIFLWSARTLIKHISHKKSIVYY